MPRKPIEAPAPVKRGHLFDKLGEVKPKRKSPPKRQYKPRAGIVVPGTRGKGWDQKSRVKRGVDDMVDLSIRPKMYRANKKDGNWTPRKVGAPKGKPNPQPKIYTDELIAKALYTAKGLTYAAAQMVGMDYSHMCHRINKSPVLLKVRQEAVERRLDLAEITLDDLVAKPGPAQLGATCFFLKCRGKERGYVERQEVTQTNAPIDLDSMNDEQLTALIDAIAKKLEERG